jgi:hypothetical protein
VYPFCDSTHQDVVIHPVEELLQIQIHHDLAPNPDVLLCLAHRLVSRTTGSEAKAEFGEGWVPRRLQNLQDGLLDKPVHHRRNAELSLASSRLGNVHPSDWLGLVGAFKKLTPDSRPVFF